MRNILLFGILFSTWLIACTKASKHEVAEQDHASESIVETTYTCPMHPQIIKNKPGKCPLCGMDLVPVLKQRTVNTDIMLSDNQIKLANITTQKASLQPVNQAVVVNARLVENEALTRVISTRVAGRIEKLFIKEIGRRVEKGATLYTVYSEMLSTLQKEYVLAKEQFETLGKTETRYESFLKAAEQKLKYYGLTPKQITNLAQHQNISSEIIFLSPASGVVTEISVSEGQSLPEGGMLFKLGDISKLWVEAELYPTETSLVKIGDNINVRVSGFENVIEATITFLSPAYRANTQITVMRATLDNAKMIYQPGMQAQVSFNHSSKKGLAVPIDAVIREGEGTHIYVQRGRNTFRPQRVTTGLESSDSVEITDGLTERDTIVVTGAYLLYSEFILKKGSNPITSHNH